MTAPAPAPRPRRRDPLLLVVAGVAVGVGMAVLQRPQTGMFVVAGALAVAAVLRLVLAPHLAGSLVVRNRRIDVAVLAGLAATISVLAAVTPFPGDRG